MSTLTEESQDVNVNTYFWQAGFEDAEAPDGRHLVTVHSTVLYTKTVSFRCSFSDVHVAGSAEFIFISVTGFLNILFFFFFVTILFS